MGLLDQALAWADNKRRVAAKNIGELVSNPGDAVPMHATGILQDLVDQFKDPMNFAVRNPLGGLLGQIAYHGSPHKFNKFSLDKIGTGEGAQAYGHGLYLAESPQVANEYAAKLGTPDILFGGKRIEELSVSDKARQLAEWIKSRAGAMQYGSQGREAREAFSRLPPEIKQELKDVEVFDGGVLYKTDIPDEAVARFLDWDKPLSQQAPGVRSFIDSVRGGNVNIDEKMPRERLQAWMDHFIKRDKRGSDLYGILGPAEKSAEVSSAMETAGVPGIRFLDQGSRAAGAGTSNFVVFDPEIIRILERNGQPTGLQPWKPGEWRGMPNP